MLNDIKEENERMRAEIAALRKEKGLPDEPERDENYVDPAELEKLEEAKEQLEKKINE
jgi:hypothetical protein